MVRSHLTIGLLLTALGAALPGCIFDGECAAYPACDFGDVQVSNAGECVGDVCYERSVCGATIVCTSPAPLPSSDCAPACTAGGPPPPPGFDESTTCYDGCNWCECTTAGAVNCTARACLDGGTRDAGL